MKNTINWLLNNTLCLFAPQPSHKASAGRLKEAFRLIRGERTFVSLYSAFSLHRDERNYLLEAWLAGWRKNKIALLLSIISLPITSMQSAVMVGNPLKSENKKEYTIRAVCPLTQRPIGLIRYQPHNSYDGTNTWEMSKLEVYDPYKRTGVGTQLLRKCIEHIQHKNGAHLFWYVQPYTPYLDTAEKAPLSLEELVIVYTKMIKKMEPPLSATTQEKEFFGICQVTMHVTLPAPL